MQKKVIIVIAVLIVLVIVVLLWKPKQGRQQLGSDNSTTNQTFESIDVESANQVPVTSGENAPPGSIHNLPVPKAVAAVRTKVAQEQNVPEGQVVILEALEHDWPDGCLGLATKEEFCTQVITPGYRVVVTVKGKEFTFRTNGDGGVVRAE